MNKIESQKIDRVNSLTIRRVENTALHLYEVDMPPRFPRRPFSRSIGFTLIEVTISLGIVSFAMVSLVGLLPAGLSSFRSAVSTTIEAQIVQSLSEDISRTDFTNLQGLTGQTYTYDSRGVKTLANDSATIYTAKVMLDPITDLNSYPVCLQDAASRNEAYNMRIQITAIGRPQVARYSLVVANEQGHIVP